MLKVISLVCSDIYIITETLFLNHLKQPDCNEKMIFISKVLVKVTLFLTLSSKSHITSEERNDNRDGKKENREWSFVCICHV